MPFFNPLTQDQYQDILKDIGADEQSIRRDVEYLIQWLEQTAYLPSVQDRKFVTAVLIRCKNSVEKAKSFMDYYYSRRTLGTDMFSLRDPCDSELKKCILSYPLIPLPKLTNDGYRIMVHINPAESAMSKMNSILSAWQIQYEIFLKSDSNKGFILIADLRHFNITQSAIFLADFMKILDLLTKTTRTRYKESYMVNVNPVFNTFFNATKQYLSGKLLGRIQMWTKKPQDLVEVLPKDILPSDFGGSERPLEELKGAWYDYVTEHREWFKAEEDVKADISKRPKDDPFATQFSAFGLSGTFRKINLD